MFFWILKDFFFLEVVNILNWEHGEYICSRMHLKGKNCKVKILSQKAIQKKICCWKDKIESDAANEKKILNAVGNLKTNGKYLYFSFFSGKFQKSFCHSQIFLSKFQFKKLLLYYICMACIIFFQIHELGTFPFAQKGNLIFFHRKLIKVSPSNDLRK